MSEHPDYEWASKKWSKGHGAVFSYTEGGPLRIDWIYNKNKLKLFYYNLILTLKWYRRNKNEIIRITRRIK